MALGNLLAELSTHTFAIDLRRGLLPKKTRVALEEQETIDEDELLSSRTKQAADIKATVELAEGCVVALITMLRNCCDAKELESGKYALFALSNVASLCRSSIVEEGGIELFVSMACSEDPDTQRQALACVRSLCVSIDHRVSVIEKGMLDPLVLLSSSNDDDIVQEVACALNCLSSEDDIKEEISYRALANLIIMLMSGDGVVEFHACGAIANLLEVLDIHTRFVEEKGLPPLISLCSSSDRPCRLEATRAVANLSSNPELTQMLVEEDSIGPLVKTIAQDGDDSRFAALAVANLTTDAPTLFHIVQGGAIPHLADSISCASNGIDGRRYCALAMANITACEAFHSVVLEGGGVEALFSLANTGDIVSMQYISIGLSNLSANTANHRAIVGMGGLQVALDGMNIDHLLFSPLFPPLTIPLPANHRTRIQY